MTDIYLTHTAYCTGWNLDEILSGTQFRKAVTTRRYKALERGENHIKMLDWYFKKPNWKTHLMLVKKYDFDVVMAPDYFESDDIDLLIERIEELKKYCKRVVIPIHAIHKRLTPYEWALPMAQGFAPPLKSEKMIWEFADNITHLLGGSPHKQYQISKYLPNLKSVDGNQIFNVAIHYFKYWENGKWIKGDDKKYSTQDIFRMSIINVDRLWNKEKPEQ